MARIRSKKGYKFSRNKVPIINSKEQINKKKISHFRPCTASELRKYGLHEDAYPGDDFNINYYIIE